MDWLNLHYSVLDSPDVIGSTPTERATWLFLLRLCIGQENGGRIKGAKGWGDRKWQQVVRVTLREVQQKTTLWGWDRDDLIVAYYPIEKEEEVRRNRDNGKRGGRPKANHLDNHPVNPLITTRFVSAETEGKGREGNRKGTEDEAGPPTPSQDIFEGMDQDEIELPIAKPMPPVPVPRGLPDFLAMHRAIFVGREERADWEAILRVWGWEPCEDAARTLGAKLKPGGRIYRTEFVAWLDDNYMDTPEPKNAMERTK